LFAGKVLVTASSNRLYFYMPLFALVKYISNLTDNK
jgi:hypothetical protein